MYREYNETVYIFLPDNWKTKKFNHTLLLFDMIFLFGSYKLQHHICCTAATNHCKHYSLPKLHLLKYPTGL